MTTARISDDDVLTIRQMCEAHDVTPRALRFYEARALLTPRRVGQQRLYGRRERARLHLILQGKRFGFSLEQIRHLLELYDPSTDNRAQITATLAAGRARLEDMRRQARELAAATGELAARIAAMEAAHPHLASDAAPALGSAPATNPAAFDSAAFDPAAAGPASAPVSAQDPAPAIDPATA